MFLLEEYKVLVMIGLVVGFMISQRSIASVVSLIVFMLSLGVLFFVGLLTFFGYLVVIVYVGAISVLFIFVVMMIEEKRRGVVISVDVKKYVVLCLVLLVILFDLVCRIELGDLCINLTWDGMCEGMILEPLGYEGTSIGIKVGEVLFSGDLDQVLVIGGLLLIGMIGGVLVGRK